MKALLREPFLHFVLIGAGLFVLYSVSNDAYEPSEKKIIVTEGKISNLATIFARTWQRAPTNEELEGLIEDYLREEVFYREAVRVGLNEDDVIIRRRMRQKMEFVAEDLAEMVEPAEEELEAYLKEHMDRFAFPPRYSFRQIYLSPVKRGESIEADALELCEALNSGRYKGDVAQLGDPLMIDFEHRQYTPAELQNSFGPRFAEVLPSLTQGEWVGPVASGYGYHLVFITEKSQGVQPSLEQVRSEVMREWQNQKRIETLDAFYESLKSQYEIEIEQPSEMRNTSE